MNYQYPPNNKAFWRNIFIIVIVTLICLGIAYIYKNHNSTSTTGPTTSQVSDDEPSLGKSFTPNKAEQTPGLKYPPTRRRFNKGSETVNFIIEYNQQTGKEIKCTMKDGNDKIRFIQEYDPKTGKEIKVTLFRTDSETVLSILEGDPMTKYKVTYYQPDGKTKDYILEYDAKTGNPFKTTDYNDDGTTVSHIEELDSEITKALKSPKASYFKADGKMMNQIEEFINFPMM